MTLPPDYPPGYENYKAETYTAHVECKNCGYEDWAVRIPKGTKVKEHPCPNCGCCDLRAVPR